MNQFKKAQVIMLPTKNNSIFGLIYELNKLHIYSDGTNPHNINDNLAMSQHLYIISDDEIKEGDWYINILDNSINFASKTFIDGSKTNCKKIIATTDTSLKYFIDGNSNKSSYELTKSGYIEFLPQPSQQFINLFIESYNKGEVITDVLVEYENSKVMALDKNSKEMWDFVTKLKINSDNTITIKPTKDSWNREELKILFKKHEKDVIKYINSSGPSATPSFNDKWIEENL